MKMDLHIHSKYSTDSLSDPKDILKTVVKKKLNAFAIADHGTLKGYKAMKKLMKGSDHNKKPMLISGIEVKSNIGDVLCLFIEKEIKSQEINTLIDEVKEQDGILVLPHPFVSHNFKKTDGFLEKFDGVETFNSRVNKNQNLKAQSLAKSLKKSELGASDSHWLETIGNGYTFIKGDILSADEIFQSIKKGSTIAKGKYTSSYYWHKSDVIRSFREPRITNIPKSVYGYLLQSMKRR